MKPLKNLFYEELSELVKYKNDLYVSLTLFLEFNTTPDEIVNKVLMTMKESDEEYDIFKDLQKGLNGEYTRERAMVLGKKALAQRVKSNIENMKEELGELTKAGDELLNTINTNLTAILDTNRSEQDVFDINKMLETLVRKEYLSFKLKSLIAPKMDTSLELQQNLESFMYNYFVVLKETLNDKCYDDLKIAYDRYSDINLEDKQSKRLVKEVLTGELDVNDIDNYIIKENEIQAMMFDVDDKYLIPTVNSMSYRSEDDPVDSFKLAITTVSDKIQKLKFSNDTLVKITKDTINRNDLSVVLDSLYNYIYDYMNSKIDLDMLVNVFKIEKSYLNNYITFINNIFNKLMGCIVNFNGDLNIITQATELNKEILVESTIPEVGVSVNNK